MDGFDHLPLFSSASERAEAGKQFGMQRALDAAAPDWKEAFAAAVYELAKSMPELSTNDVWAVVEAAGFCTSENRASGPVMSQCARRGWIEFTPRTIKSTRPQRNKGDVRVWRSLLYGRAAA